MKGYVTIRANPPIDGGWKWTIFAYYPNSPILLRIEAEFAYSSVDSADRAAKRWAKKLGIDLGKGEK